MRPTPLSALMLSFLFFLVTPSRVSAQILQAEWVQESQKEIDKHRMADLRVLVLNASGQPVPDAAVQVRQTRHAFTWSVKLDPRATTTNLPMGSGGLRVWRCFNALSMARSAQWAKTQPKAEQWNFRDVETLLNWAQGQGLAPRWGGVIPADFGRWPNWAAKLEGQALQEAIEAHARRCVTEYHRRVDQFDLLTLGVQSPGAPERITPAAARQLYENAHSLSLRTTFGLRFEDGLSNDRILEVTRTIVEMQQAQVPFDIIVLETRLSGTVMQPTLVRSLDRIAALNVPIYIADLEVTGPTASATAINLETALRVFFAHPAVMGITVAGVTSDTLSDPTAALLDDLGQPTQAGITLDRMVRNLWWTEKTAPTDELGNLRTRVFAGWYDLEARLPDGSTANMQVHVPARASKERLVVMQPLNASKPAGGAAR